MSTAAIIVMIIGMVIIWGGLAASVANAVRKGRQAEPGTPARPDN